MVCLDLEQRRTIWRYEAKWKCRWEVVCYAAEAINEGRAAMIMVVLGVMRRRVPEMSVVCCSFLAR